MTSMGNVNDLTLGERISIARRRAGIDGRTLAAKLETSQGSVSNWELDKARPSLALAHVICGVLLCVTVIGIPLGVASFKMARLALFPFGKRIVRAADAVGVPGAVMVPQVG